MVVRKLKSLPLGVWLGCMLALITPGILEAQPSRWFSRPWQTDDGLPNNTIFGMAQTPDGYLWLGTPTGLVRFDGLRFQKVSSTNFVQAPNRGILSMIRFQDGGLGLAMDRGAVVLLRSNSPSIFLPGEQLPDGVPYLLAEDREGAIWLSYREGSLCRIFNGKVTRLIEAAGSAAAPGLMCALVSDPAGDVWFARNGEFGKIHNGQLEPLCAIASGASRLAASKNGIWIAAGNRLLKFEGKVGLKDLGEFNPGPATVPTALLEDREGSVWIGTAYQGLRYFDGKKFETIPTTHKEITSLLEDQEGSLWVGTTGGGLNQIRARIIELEGTEEGLPFEAVQSICEDAQGVYWAATQNGELARRVGGRWNIFRPSPDWNGQAICVTSDAAGTIWIGTRLSGIFCWKDNRLQKLSDANDLKGRTVHTLQLSKSGDLWMGEASPDALQLLHNGELKTLNVPTTDLRVIRATTEDAEGAIWVGTSRGLLLRVKQDQVTDETDRTMGELASIRCLYTSPDGTVWVGYAGWGLGRIRNGHFTNIRTEQGLYDDYISHIVADEHGWLWFGSDRGIFKVRQQEIDDYSQGRIKQVRSIHYGQGDGLPSLQANFGGAPGSLRSRDGRIWMPMRTALAVIYPDRLRENVEPPPVLLDRVVVDDVTVAHYRSVLPLGENAARSSINPREANGPLQLSPGHHRVQFEFASPSFVDPENVRFRYRLENSDDDWRPGDSERTASYSRLPAGRYRFQVIAGNNDDLWNKEGASLEIVVSPFVWQTWWFRIITLTVFTLLIVAIVRYVSFRRLRLQLRTLEQQQALHKERARIAKDIHDDVGANLTQIALMGDLVQQDAGGYEVFGPRLENISKTARQAVKSLDEIVWAVNPRNDTLAHLIDYTGQFAVDYLRVVGIRCRLDLPDQTPPREVSTDVRHNLFLVVKEALHNIVKHAHATEVWLRVQATSNHVRIVVEDNGVGFELRPAGVEADGLRNMQQRIADIGGECRIESMAGSGTRVTVDFPWPLKYNC